MLKTAARTTNAMPAAFSLDCAAAKAAVPSVAFNSHKCGSSDARNNMAVYASSFNASVFRTTESAGYAPVTGATMR